MAFTFFFRDVQTLRLVEEKVIPPLAGRKAIHIWDAGCAMGPEPYSLAIILREGMGQFAFRKIQIHATDMDPDGRFESIVREGIYPYEQVKRIPEEIRAKYFSPAEKSETVKISDEVKLRVTFQQHDLLTLKPPMQGKVNLVVCKNVLLHFNDQQRADVLRMFHDALEPGGHLVTEQTQELPTSVSSLFERVVEHTRLYRKAG